MIILPLPLIPRQHKIFNIEFAANPLTVGVPYCIVPHMQQREQISTYLTTPEDKAQWDIVKNYFDEGDSSIIRQLIREKCAQINGGETKRQSLVRIESKIIRILDILERSFEPLDLGEEES